MPSLKYLFIMIGISIVLFCFPVTSFADNHTTGETTPTEVDLSQVDWDDEEPVEGVTEETDLSQIDWDDEEPATETNGDLSEINWDEDEPVEEVTPAAPKVEKKKELRPDEADPLYHWKWGIFFFIYLLGIFFTAHFTRKRGISLKLPPELLIVLHTFWPLEWLLLPFIKMPETEMSN